MNSSSAGTLNRINLVEGGQKNIQTPKGIILRNVWREDTTGEYIIQYKRKWNKVNREVVNNTEIFTII